MGTDEGLLARVRAEVLKEVSETGGREEKGGRREKPHDLDGLGALEDAAAAGRGALEVLPALLVVEGVRDEELFGHEDALLGPSADVLHTLGGGRERGSENRMSVGGGWVGGNGHGVVAGREEGWGEDGEGHLLEG